MFLKTTKRRILDEYLRSHGYYSFATKIREINDIDIGNSFGTKKFVIRNIKNWIHFVEVDI